MKTDPWRRVGDLWAWLPAFRAVAETQHLPTAAARLGLTPSALSRSVRALEDHLGRSLFERVGRRIVLNAEGEILLRSVRDAMRGVHGGVLEVGGEGFAGPFRVAGAGVVTTAYLLPALMDLQARWPRLEPTLTVSGGVGVVERLLSGTLDVAFQSLPVSHPNLEVVLLGAEPNHVWCGRRHPLFGSTRITLDELLAWPFVAPPHGPDDASPEGWPVHLRRRILLQTDAMHIGLRMCRDGHALAVLPDAVAVEAGEDLWPLPLDVVPSTPMWAAYRTPVGVPGRAEALVASVRARIAARREPS